MKHLRKHTNRILIAAMACVATVNLASCRRPSKAPARPPSAPIQLSDVTDLSGITFVHTDGSTGERYIMETITAGLATFDYDGDGLLDVYFLNGANLDGEATAASPRNALYRNEGGWRFRDVTELAGVGDTGFGLGVAVGDYDSDGDADLFVNNYGPNVFYRNNGDGTFEEATEPSGLDQTQRVGAGANFLDIEGDGDLDLYVANYVKFSREAHGVMLVDGYELYYGPRDYRPDPDQLYRNNGDGTFQDISQESGIGQHAGTGMGSVCCDYDADGDTDIFILNDVAGNFLYVNDGVGQFEEQGLVSGGAYNAQGDELGSMGIDCGDYNNDGWLDFYMTSYQSELPVLYENLGGRGLEDVTTRANAGDGMFPYVTWGTGLVDFDNDGDRDLFIACGHLQDNVDLYDDTSAYLVRNVLLMNTGDGKFENISARCGDGLLPEWSSRGTAFDDLDNDGDIDGVVLNSRQQPTLIRNDSPENRHWIDLRLIGIRSNRDGVGAQVRVIAGDLAQTAEVHSGRGYQSHFGTRLHFGVGPGGKIDRVEVRWVGGGQEVWENVPLDERVTLIEGSSRP